MNSNKTKNTYLLVFLLAFLFIVPLFAISFQMVSKNSEPLDDPSQLETVATVIKLHVMDAVTGADIPGAFVEYTPTAGGAYESGSTQSTGRFNPGSCTAGTYNVTIYKPGYKLYIKYPVILQNQETKYYEIFLERDTTVSIYGFILVNVTASGSPESGVTVQCVNSSGIVATNTTGGSGLVNITGLDAGIYNVTVSKTGFFTQSKGAILYFAGDNETVNFNLVATPPNPGWIEVTVRDNESTPLQSALVQVRNATDQALVVVGLTNPDGFFNATGLGIGWYNVTASKDGYIPETKDDHISSAGQEDYLNFYLIPYGPESSFIEVTVLDGNLSNSTVQFPLNNSYVNIIYQDSGQSISAGLTDGTGIHNATGLQIGWYDIYVSKAGYAPTKLSNKIDNNGEGDRLIIYLAPTDPISLTVRAFVRDADATWVAPPNCLVSFKQYGSIVGITNTFSTGFAETSGISNTTAVEITVSRAGYQTNITTFNFTGTNAPALVEAYIYLKANSPASGVIHVYVIDRTTSNPVANATVTLIKPDKSTISLGDTPATGYVNATGLNIGTYTINVTRDNYFSKEESTTIDTDGDEDTLPIILTRKQFIHFELVLEEITPNPDPTGDIDLYWNVIEFAVGYGIYRGNNTGNLELIATVGAGVKTYKDVGVEGFFYYYKIVATNGTHEVVSNIESVAVFQAGVTLDPLWILVILGAIASGTLAMFILIIDEMRRDYNKGTPGKMKKAKKVLKK